MSLTEVVQTPGPELVAWLAERVRGRESPLDPLTLVVPTNYLGMHLRRELATGGYANVRSTVLARLAESLGAERLAREGWRPLTESQNQAAIRRTVTSSMGSLKNTTPHLALIRTLQRLFRTIREQHLTGAQLAEIASSGQMARDAVDAYHGYRTLVEQSRSYDRADLYVAATAAAADGPQRLSEWGALIAIYLADVEPVESAFLGALAEHSDLTEITFPPFALSAFADDGTSGDRRDDHEAEREQRLIIAPDAAQEVDAVVREVLASVERGMRLDRVAVVYRDSDAYSKLTRETLRRGDVPLASLDGRPLSESLPGRILLGLLRVREQDFYRPAVVEWHGLLPHGAGDWVPVADWERLSREAGVVKGAEQWQKRLDRLIDRLEGQRADLDKKEGASEALKNWSKRKTDMATRMRNRIAALATSTETPAEETWPALSAWASQLLKEFVKEDRDWDEREHEAYELIASELEGLSAASEIETGVGVATFLGTLTEVLQARRQTEGRFGHGVVVGSIGGIAGMAFERLYVLGVTERRFPTPPAADPILPLQEEIDLLGKRARHLARERANFGMAQHAAPPGGVTVSFPLWDADIRPLYPSPWLSEIASSREGTALQAAEVRELHDRDWLLRVSEKAAAGLTPLNVAGHRMQLATREYRGRSRLLASPLALRPELPLGAGLRLTEARRSDQLTQYDGCLADAAADSRLVQGGLASSIVSPTAIQGWAACPFSYFLDRWLRVEPTELPEDEQQWSLNPMERGSVVHEILERFFGELATSGAFVPSYRYSAADHRRIDEIALEVFDRVEREGKTGLALAWQNDKAVILQDLHILLDRDQEERGPSLVPTYLEQAFGFGGEASWPVVVVPVGNSREVRIRGRIDRVDVGTGTNGPSHIRVIDYKTGSAKSSPDASDPLLSGTRLQLAAYGKAVAGWLAGQGLAGATIDAAYWFNTSKGKFQLAEQRIEDRIDGLFDHAIEVIDEGMTHGCFAQVPGGDTQRGGRSSWDNCVYCPYDRICPSARDQLYDRKRADGVAAQHGRLATELGQNS